MDYFRVKNWERFQHYKRRNPPWIKLYTSLLDDYEFGCLQDASKLLALCILMLAAKTGNKLPLDAAWLHKKTGLDQAHDLEPLFECGFIVRLSASELLARCGQSATPETEERIHTEGLKAVSSERMQAFKASLPAPNDNRHSPSQAVRIASTKT